MDGYLGEIRMFGGDYAPKNWVYCDGIILDISQFSSLFSILGTQFGGDGRINFAVPDLRGRVAIHRNWERYLGMMGGAEYVYMDSRSMPLHTHSAVVQGSTASVTGVATATMHVNNGNGTIHTPNGNFLSSDENQTNIYSTTSSGNNALSDQAITVNTDNLTINTSGVQVEIEPAGELLAKHYNMQPYTVLNYIMCIVGEYPTRN